MMPIQPEPIKFPIIPCAWLGNCMKTASQIVKTPSAALLWRIATSIFDDTATYIKAHKLTVEQQQPAACRSPAYRHKKRLLSVCLPVCLFPSDAHRHLDTQMIWSVPVFGGKNYSFGVQKESVWFSLTVFFSSLEVNTYTGTHLAEHTSTDWRREVPHGSVSGVGDAGESGVSVQDITGHAAVLDLVPHSEAAAAA